MVILCGSIAALGSEETGFETVHTSNAAILNRLGLAPLQIPDGHHKKRLAGPEPPGLNSPARIHQAYSRRHGHRDSHVYIVKLPASPPYYTITKPHKSAKDEKVTKTGPNFPVGFQGNGKPAKIYHWNLPVVKKITEKKRLQAQLRLDQSRRKLEDSRKRQQLVPGASKNLPEKIEAGGGPVPKTATGHEGQDGKKRYYASGDNRVVLHQKSAGSGKHVRNNDKRLSYPTESEEEKKRLDAGRKNAGNLGNKTYRLEDSGVHRIHLSNELHGSRNTAAKVKKHRKKAAMSYYAPIAGKPGTTSIHKNFPGNGKPKAFYVMEKSRKPVYYHPLLP